MEIYTVTYCTMDQEVGANLLWHTCLLLSRLDETTKKLEVIETWGFYGVPSTDTGSLLRKLKARLGLDVDFSGNHGMLRHEEMRFLDRGCGLHGVTFEITKENFEKLKLKCKTMEANQSHCINTIAESYHLLGKPKDEARIYPLENEAVHLYEIEKTGAEILNRSPRLKEFKLGLFGDVNTCKVQAIKLLDGILTPEQITRVTGLHRAISRFSGKMEEIYLHSSGQLRIFKKNNIRYRHIDDHDAKLYWTIPPQEMEALTSEVHDSFTLYPEHCNAVKNVVRKLQRLEWLFINAKLDEQYSIPRNEMVARIRSYYEYFSMITPNNTRPTSSDLSSPLRWLFSLPKDNNEKILVDKISEIENFINAIYMAIIDDWGSDQEEASDANYFTENIEALAAVLPPEKKKELCKLIVRNYVEPDDLCLWRVGY